MWQTRHTAARSGSQGQYGRNCPSPWLLSGQVFGRGRCNAIPPEYWIAGRRSAVAGRCPSVLVLGFAALNPFYGGAIAHEAEGDSVAYSASSGRVGWVERSETHRMNQRRRGAGWQQWGCGMNTDDSRIIARFQRLTTELLAQNGRRALSDLAGARAARSQKEPGVPKRHVEGISASAVARRVFKARRCRDRPSTSRRSSRRGD